MSAWLLTKPPQPRISSANDRANKLNKITNMENAEFK